MKNNFDSSKYKPIIITIDGTGASGKGTILKGLKKLLDNRYNILDAGTMYRALSFYFLSKNIMPEELIKDKKLSANLRKEVRLEYDGGNFKLNGNFLNTNEIRGPHIDSYVGKYAAIDEVKKYIVELQKNIVESTSDKYGWILDGRCMGSAVAPQAQAKFFVDAPALVRAERRHKDYEDMGKGDISVEKVLIEIGIRDKMDYSTNIAPLVKPQDAVEIDSFKFSKDEAVAHALKYVQERIQEEGKL